MTSDIIKSNCHVITRHRHFVNINHTIDTPKPDRIKSCFEWVPASRRIHQDTIEFRGDPITLWTATKEKQRGGGKEEGRRGDGKGNNRWSRKRNCSFHSKHWPKTRIWLSVDRVNPLLALSLLPVGESVSDHNRKSAWNGTENVTIALSDRFETNEIIAFHPIVLPFIFYGNLWDGWIKMTANRCIDYIEILGSKKFE